MDEPIRDTPHHHTSCSCCCCCCCGCGCCCCMSSPVPLMMCSATTSYRWNRFYLLLLLLPPCRSRPCCLLLLLAPRPDHGSGDEHCTIREVGVHARAYLNSPLAAPCAPAARVAGRVTRYERLTVITHQSPFLKRNKDNIKKLKEQT